MNLQQSVSSLQAQLEKQADSILELKSSSTPVACSMPCRSGKNLVDTSVTCKQEKLNRLEELTRDFQMTQMALMQSQKIESLGELANGMAREINTPLQYIGGHLEFMSQAFDELTQGMALSLNLLEEQGLVSEAIQTRKNKLDYVMSRLPRALSQSLEGIDAVSKVVRAMRGFSDATEDWLDADVNDCIDSAITISQSKWKPVADIKFQPDPNLPILCCHPGQLTEAFMNLVTNASQAVEEKVGTDTDDKGAICIRTFQQKKNIGVEISDTGIGIPNELEDRIFEPFFTTKEHGKSAGQGLSVCRSVFVDEHGGKINVQSSENGGATFTVFLPITERAA